MRCHCSARSWSESAGMQNGNFLSEDLMQIGRDRRRQSNFRNQQNGGASSFEHRTHRRKIDRGLARSGDAMQQHAAKTCAQFTLLLN